MIRQVPGTTEPTHNAPIEARSGKGSVEPFRPCREAAYHNH